MKKYFFLTVCLCVLLMLTAHPIQAFEKGTRGLGGTISFNGYKGTEDSDTRYSLSLAPQVSYFLWNNFSVDVNVFLETSWAGNMSPFTDLGIGLGGRYFYKKFYGGVYYNYYARRSKTTVVVEGDLAYDGYNWRKRSDLTFKVGRLFGIAKNVYFDFGVYYNIGIGKITNSVDELESFDNERSEFGTLAGLAIFF